MQPLPDFLREEYPFKSRFKKINNYKMHYIDEGRGPVVLCLHGNPSWSFYFRSIVKKLSENYRVIAPDHIGMGLSEKPALGKYPFSLKQRVLDIETLLEKLSIDEPLHLTVHDWGGMIGSLLALRKPDRIASMIISNTAAFLKPENKKLPLGIYTAKKILPIAGPGILLLNLFSLSALAFCAKKPLSKNIRRGYLFPYRRFSERLAQLAFVQDIPLTYRDKSYSLVKWSEENLHLLKNIPKCILWGERDFVFDSDYKKIWESYFPEAPSYNFPFAGHYLFEDEALNCIKIIENFLLKHKKQKTL